MKWLRKSKSVVPEDPATEKQVDYIISLVGEAGSKARSVLRRPDIKIKSDPSSAASYSSLSKDGANVLINGLLNVIPATDGQIGSIVHNFSFTYEGGSAEDKADFAMALEIASPSGDPTDPASYSHLSKGQATAALNLLIG